VEGIWPYNDVTSLAGGPYKDADGNRVHPLINQPVIVPGTGEVATRVTYQQALELGAGLSLSIEKMFAIGQDAASRAAAKTFALESMMHRPRRKTR
jgi:hypothetical protein